MDCQKYLDALHREIKPALGCTEPIAVALAVAKAMETPGCRPEKITLWVSTNIFERTPWAWGIPGTGMVGLEIASALSCIAGRSAYGLEVLSAATPEDCEAARVYAATGCIHVHTKMIRRRSSTSRRIPTPMGMKLCASSRTRIPTSPMCSWTIRCWSIRRHRRSIPAHPWGRFGRGGHL